jgi:hypothetical protein
MQRLSTVAPMQAQSLRLLTWMVCAKRPMKWREIQCAISIDLDDQIVDWDRKRFAVDSKELCGSLVELHADGTVNLVHHTAKWYGIQCNGSLLKAFSFADFSSYLVDQKVVDVGAGEAELALLCVGYLSFPCFDIAGDDANLSAFVSLGYYGLFDYAYAYWSHHAESCARLHRSKDALEQLCEATEVFVETHWIEPQAKRVVRQAFIERWKPLENNGNLDKLVLAGWIAQRQTITSTKTDPNEQVLALHRMVARIRACLEEAWAVPSKIDRIRLIYGNDIFKCPRVNCVRFYNGFVSEQLRNDHVPKHERSFFCSFPGCAMATLGYATLKELQRHENDYHGTIDSDNEEPEYPELAAEKVSFQCAQCDAKFTRNNNLKIHMRKHNAPDQKSFVCSQCGQSYSRLGDRTRHESTNHSNAKHFACGGTLKDGTAWGCGREYSRGDMLNRHWKSERGKTCIRPKEREEAIEAASSTMTPQPSGAPTPVP